MLGLDITALAVGFAAGAVLWGGLSFILDWIVGKIKARNTPDYPAEVAYLNGRVLELESALQDTTSSAEFQLGELQATNDALRAELAEREQDAASAHHLQEQMGELEAQAASAGDMQAALAEMTARAEAAEASLDEAKVTLIAAERALRAVEEKSRTSLMEIQGTRPAQANGAAPATTAEMLTASAAEQTFGADEDADAPQSA